MKNEKTLRVLVIISLVYSVSQAVYLLFTYIKVPFDISNPLIPKYLIDYVRFPIYFLFPIFLLISIISYNLIRNKAYQLKSVLPIFGILIFYFLFGAYIYQFIQSFNPYG